MFTLAGLFFSCSVDCLHGQVLRVPDGGGGHAQVISPTGSACASCAPLGIHVASTQPKSFNDAEKYGMHAELFCFSLQNMRRETGPMEPGHASIESPIFDLPFTRLADVPSRKVRWQ